MPSTEPTRQADDRRSQAPENENTPQWRVSPAPDGRGGRQEDGSPLIPRRRRWWALLAGLLLVNLVVAFATGGAADRQQVP
jgi:hypothetical protein